MTSPNITRLPVAVDPVAAMTAAMTEGDEGAFCRFYEGYCDRLYRYLIVLFTLLSDDELLALFPDRPVALVALPSGGKKLLWLEAGEPAEPTP